MARLPRVVIVDVAHHVTQRGNARQVILANDADRIAYLELLRQYSELHRLSLLGYCLMCNHVHLVVIPRTSEALAQALKQTHDRYASYWNARMASSGHVWQGRFYSCPLDDSHLWAALPYVEMNPVRDWNWGQSRLSPHFPPSPHFPCASTTSTFGPSANESRSCATWTATRSNGDWSKHPSSGCGAAFATAVRSD